MRLLPFVLLYVAVASAFSPFNLAARQESVISTEVVTSTSIVISTSILTITEYATATRTIDIVQDFIHVCHHDSLYIRCCPTHCVNLGRENLGLRSNPIRFTHNGHHIDPPYHRYSIR